MLDIGVGRGALVVYTSDGLGGREIEIRPHEGTWAGEHTAVRPRRLGDRVLHAGVFGSLPAGPYDLRVRTTGNEAGTTTEVVPTVTVEEGAVVEIRWPGGGRSS
jgi:hypothetical protein